MDINKPKEFNPKMRGRRLRSGVKWYRALKQKRKTILDVQPS
jgi:hypothetical protein